MSMPPLTFRSFDGAGEPLLTLPVTERLLPSQTHALPVLEAIDRRLASGDRAWRMCLTVEDSALFDIEFSSIGQEAAVVRIHRDEINSLLILLTSGQVDLAMMSGIQKALETIVPAGCLAGVFDWLTGTMPPMAAMVHVNGPSNNGMDMLGMCIADRFFKRCLERA